MIYFDNAATGGFKPRTVTESIENVIRYLSANPGRSGHRLSITGAEIVYDCRKELAKFFDAKPERVIFTKNCTEALNMAIFGSLKRGGHIITTVYEHNSVLRPLNQLKESGLISLDIVEPDIGKDIVSKIKEKINKNTYQIITTSISNVNGEELPIDRIAKMAKENNLEYICDGAQGGGHIPLSLSNGISMLCLAGHKGLYGIMGSGVLILDENTDISPLIYGGTGTESINLNQPFTYPEKLESGTLSLPAIVGLLEGTRYISSNINHFSEQLFKYSENVITMLEKIENVKCYSRPNHAGIIAFSIENLGSMEVADKLNNEYDIAVRGGLHCAPLMHKFLGTDKDGLIRVSLAVQNSTREISYFIHAIKEIANFKSF